MAIRVNIQAMMFLMTIWLACAPKKLTPEPGSTARAQVLFEKHVAAIGGEAMYRSRKNAVIKGKIRRMDASVEYRFVTAKVAPNHIRTTVNAIGGSDKIQRGFDGKIAWMKIRGTSSKLSGKERQDVINSSEFHSELNYFKRYPTIYRIAEIQFGGRPCHSVFAKNALNQFVEIYFDKDLGLKRGMSIWEEGKPNERTWVRFGHYVDIEGTRVPFSIEEIKGKSHKLTLIDSYKWNVLKKQILAPKSLRKK